MTSPAKDVIDQTSPTKKVHVIDLVSPSVMSTNITIDLTTPPPYSSTSLEDQMIKLKVEVQGNYTQQYCGQYIKCCIFNCLNAVYLVV